MATRQLPHKQSSAKVATQWPTSSDQRTRNSDPDRVVSAELLNSFVPVVKSLGGDPRRLLAQAGISATALSVPDAKISLEAIGELLELAAAALECPDFGMRLAEQQQRPPQVMKPLDQLVSNAPTLEHTWRCCENYMEAYSSGMLISLKRDATRALHALRVEIFVTAAHRFPQLIEQLVLLTNNGAICLSNGAAHAREIWFSHASQSNPAVYLRKFAAPVKFNENANKLFFTEADLRTRVVNRNPVVYDEERRHISDRFAPPVTRIKLQVRQSIAELLAEADCTMEAVADSFAMHSRTLHRQLRKAGTNFEAIREEVRMDLTLRYLGRPQLSLTEVAARLGYAEPSVFSRSCRRWFDSSPTQLRRQLLSGAEGLSRLPD